MSQLFQQDPLTSSPAESEDGTGVSLKRAAQWARLLSILGFIFSGCLMVYAIFIFLLRVPANRFSGNFGAAEKIGLGLPFSFVFGSIICFLPFLFLYQFAVNIKKTVGHSDSYFLNRAYHRLTLFFIFLVVFALAGILLLLRNAMP